MDHLLLKIMAPPPLMGALSPLAKSDSEPCFLSAYLPSSPLRTFPLPLLKGLNMSRMACSQAQSAKAPIRTGAEVLSVDVKHLWGDGKLLITVAAGRAAS